MSGGAEVAGTERWVVAGTGVLLAVVVGVAVALPTDPRVAWLLAWWLAWLASLAVALVPRPLAGGLLLLTAWIGVSVLAGATVAVLDGHTTLGSYDFTPGTTAALRLWTIAQLTILAGSALARLGPPTRRAARLRPRLAAVRLDRWALWCLALGVLAFVVYAVIARADLATLNALTGEAAYGDFAKSTTGPELKYLQSLAGLTGVALVLAGLRVTVAGRAHLWIPLAVAGTAAAFLLASGGRSQLVVPVAVGALVWLRTSRAGMARHPRALVLGGLALLFVFAALVGGVRGQEGQKEIDSGEFAAKELRGGIFPATAALVDAMPARIGYLDGRSFADGLTLPLPRALWPDKPDGALAELQPVLYGAVIGASFALPGELYANGGLPLVALGCLFVGWFAERLWQWFRSSDRIGTTLLAATGLVVLVQVFSRGNVGAQLAGLAGFVLGMAAVAHRSDRLADRLAARATSADGVAATPANVLPPPASDHEPAR